jgi:molecular chaperone DnaJ
MTPTEAYSELGLSPGANKDDINQAFRRLAKEWHPDKNKSPDAEAKFKKINEAKTTLENPVQEQHFSGFGGIPQEMFQFINMSRMHQNSGPKRYPDPVVEVNLTFLEAMTGTKRSASYDKYVKCSACAGQGSHKRNNKCTHCDGRGGKVFQQGVVQRINVCNSCGGSGKENIDCDKCNGEGVSKQSVSSDFELPFPLRDGTVIAGQGGGNYLGSNGDVFGRHQDYYGVLKILVHVEKDPDMRLDDEGENIETDISISLLESLKGKSIKVKTIKGERGLKIHPGTKNGTKLRMQGYGPGNQNGHIFNINVSYPEDCSKLIEFLEENR